MEDLLPILFWPCRNRSYMWLKEQNEKAPWYLSVYVGVIIISVTIPSMRDQENWPTLPLLVFFLMQYEIPWLLKMTITNHSTMVFFSSSRVCTDRTFACLHIKLNQNMSRFFNSWPLCPITPCGVSHPHSNGCALHWHSSEGISHWHSREGVWRWHHSGGIMWQHSGEGVSQWY